MMRVNVREPPFPEAFQYKVAESGDSTPYRPNLCHEAHLDAATWLVAHGVLKPASHWANSHYRRARMMDPM